MAKRKPVGYDVSLSASTVETLERKLTDAKVRTQAEFSSAVDKMVAETEIRTIRDILSTMGLMLTFGIKGKAEIHPSPNRKMSHCD